MKQDYVNVDWSTWKPIEGNPYCASCRKQIAQEIRRELERELSIFKTYKYDADTKTVPIFDREWQAFWQKREKK